MRLLLVTSSFPSHPDDAGNAGVFVAQLARELRVSGHDVTVVTPQRITGDFGFDVRTIRWPGTEASLTHLDPRKPTTLLQFGALLVSGAVTVPLLARRLRAERVVALWAVPSGLFALAARILARTPYDVWALGSDIWKIDDYPFGRSVLRAVLGRADRRHADGFELAADVAAIGAGDCGFLPSSRVLPPPTEGAVHPHDDATRLLAVARFHPHKGLDVLIEALARLGDDERRRLHLDIHGGGPQLDDLVQLVEQHDLGRQVTIHGFIGPQALADELAACDVAVIPSRLESIPVVLSDVAQSDVPFIATDTGDMGTLVERHGAGAVVAAGDVDALAEALRRCATGDRPGSSEGRRALTAELGLHHAAAELSRPVGRPQDASSV